MKWTVSQLEGIKIESILTFFHDYKFAYLLSLLGSKNNYSPSLHPPTKVGKKGAKMHFRQIFKEQIM